MTHMTPEQRAKHLKTIEKIEHMARPAKWREIKKFTLELHPGFKAEDKGFAQACQEMRQASQDSIGTSKSGHMRNTMKLPNYLYEAIIKLDPDIVAEQSGRNRGAQILIGEQLWKAFPEYRISQVL